MTTLTINGLDFVLWEMFGRVHVECRGIVCDFDTRDGALFWCLGLAHS